MPAAHANLCADFCAGFFGRRSAGKTAGPCKEIREKIVAQTANPSHYYSCSSCRTAARFKDSLLVKLVGAVRPTPSPFCWLSTERVATPTLTPDSSLHRSFKKTRGFQGPGVGQEHFLQKTARCISSSTFFRSWLLVLCCRAHHLGVTVIRAGNGTRTRFQY